MVPQQLHSAGHGSVLPPDSLSPFLTSENLLPFIPLASPEKPVLPTGLLQPLLQKDGQGRKDAFTITELLAGPVPSITCVPAERCHASRATQLVGLGAARCGKLLQGPGKHPLV